MYSLSARVKIICRCGTCGREWHPIRVFNLLSSCAHSQASPTHSSGPFKPLEIPQNHARLEGIREGIRCIFPCIPSRCGLMLSSWTPPLAPSTQKQCRNTSGQVSCQSNASMVHAPAHLVREYKGIRTAFPLVFPLRRAVTRPPLRSHAPSDAPDAHQSPPDDPAPPVWQP